MLVRQLRRVRPAAHAAEVGTDFAMKIGARNFLYAFSTANRLRSSVEDAPGPLNFD
jgi:hypothetical protein